MANEPLKTALQHAGLQPDDLAEIIEVDVKTVRRWLHGARPYPRHRTRIARALESSEVELWPELTPPPLPTPDERAAGPDGEESDGGAGWDLYSELDHVAMIERARERIDIVLGWWDELLEDPAVVRALERQHAAGRQVRVILTASTTSTSRTSATNLTTTSSTSSPTPSRSTATTMRFSSPLRWIARAPYPDSLPVIRLTPAGNPNKFDGYAEHLEMFWAQPLLDDGEEDIELDEMDQWADAEVERDQTREPSSARPGVGAENPRRWPGRRTG